jgi:hypothetical protein
MTKCTTLFLKNSISLKRNLRKENRYILNNLTPEVLACFGIINNPTSKNVKIIEDDYLCKLK